MSGEADKRFSGPLAVVGLGCRLPRAPDLDGLWTVLDQGIDAITEVPEGRWNADAVFDPVIGTPGKMNTRRGGFIEDVDRFDAQLFGISPREANEMDPQQRILLEVAWQALERGGIAPSSLAGSRTGVYVGIGGSDYAHLAFLHEDHLSRINPYTGTGNAHSIAANRLSYCLDLHGPSVAIDTACSSSLVALHLACASLLAGESDLAIAGGVNVLLSPEVSIAFSHAHMLAADGRCKAFDAAADGYVRGEGCGLVVLKRLADAHRDGNRIFALVRGTAVNQDGRSNGLTAPSGLAQQAVMRTALASSGLRPDEVGYVEAHGTGTPLGDPIEMRALTAVLSEGRAPDEVCAIGSIKTNIGHLETASGVAGLLKAILALEHEIIPAHLHLTKLNEHLGLREGTFVIPREARPWPRTNRPRHALVSSYGFGGTNACVIVEEAPPAPRVESSTQGTTEPGTHLLCLSARTPGALAAIAGRLISRLELEPGLDARDLCYTTAVGREHFAAHRLAVTGESTEALREGLADLVAGRTIPGAFSGAPRPGRRPLAFLFTGQGAQFTGMGSELYASVPAYREALDACAQIADPLIDGSLLTLMFDPAERARLDETRFAQPALFALDHALFAMWTTWGLRPDALIGHSLGEIVAATAAGVLPLEAALALVCERGRLMQQMPSGGAMLAVAASERKLAEFLPGHPSLSIAAVNGPLEIVVSGDAADISALGQRLEEAGIDAAPLHVSHAFHSRHMEPILGAFEEFARRLPFQPPRIPLISNLTGELFPEGEIPSAAYYARHIRSTVRFADGLAALRSKNCAAHLELGPSAILTELGRRSDAGNRDSYLPSLRPTRQLATTMEAAAALYARGIDLDWRQFYAGRERTPIPLPTYAFERERFWLEEHPLHAQAATPPVESTPLLGRRLATALPTFESHLTLREQPWLADHRVAGTVLMPAAGYLCLSLAATRQAIGRQGVLTLSEASFVRPLVLGEESVRIQVIATPDALGRYSVSVYGSESDGPSAQWTLHASARVAPAKPASEPTPDAPPWKAIQQRCATPLTGEALYARLAAATLDYGPSFQGVAEAWVGEDEAVGRLTVPAQLAPAIAGTLRQSWFHPLLLDSALHVLAVAASPDRGTFIPTGLRSLRLESDQPMGESLWVTAAIDRATSSSQRIEGRLTIHDDKGRLLASLDGLTAQRVGAESSTPRLENALHELHWEPAPVAGPADLARLASGGAWIALVDRGGFGEWVARRMESAGATVVRAPSREREGPEELERLFAELHQKLPHVEAILDFWALDAPAPAGDLEQDLSALDKAISVGPISALHVAQAVARSAWAQPPALCLITSGAVAVKAEPVSAAQAPVWGFGRTLAQEMPEFQTTLLDLPAPAGPREIEQLCALLSRGALEPQLALRNGETFIARLRHRTAPAAADSASVPVTPYRLDSSRPGSLDALGLRPSARRSPRAGEVEIAARAAGLNFRDVMKALGIYPMAPGDTAWYGDECAGEVVAVGEGVTSLRRGDRVVAMAPSAFAEFVTTPAAFAARLPESLSDAQAATVLVAFSTACHGLLDLAKLQKGERVLIHGGAGGVGLAALQVARDVGAEIFATAGTPERRELLLRQGAAHALDSRSLSFVEEIRGLTGGYGIDVVLNSLSGEALRQSFALLAPHGRFVEIGKTDIYLNEKLDLQPFMRNLSFFSVDIERLFRERPEQATVLLKRLLGRIVEKRYQPLPFTEYALTDAAAAFRDMSQSRHAGKYVFRIPARKAEALTAEGIRGEATYLVTGGTGALGLRTARSLVDRGARYLMLCSRGAPTPAVLESIDELRARGAEVRTEQLDVADSRALRELLRRMEESMPLLRGVFHAAGLIDDGMVLRQTAARSRAVMRPKIHGSWNLHLATRALPLDFFVTYSSVASVLGSPGQSAYAAGNAFLDALASLRRSAQLPSLNVNWGPWGEAGMAARVTQRDSVAKPLRPIAPEEGIELLWRLLAEQRRSDHTPSHDALVFDVEWPRFFQTYPTLLTVPLFEEAARSHGSTSSAPAASRLMEELRALGLEARVSRLEALARGRLARILGTAETNITAEMRLQDLGVDSLMAVELHGQLEHDLGCTLPRALLIQSPTVGGIAQRLATLAQST